jgi:hypothetical protein
VIVSAFQAFGNYTSAIRGLTAPAVDVSALPGLNPEIPTCQVPNKMRIRPVAIAFTCISEVLGHGQMFYDPFRFIERFEILGTELWRIG